MAPQPKPQPTQVELDMERKEELIIAKQLRACRVNILPKTTLETFGHQTKSKKPIPVVRKHLDIPKPRLEHVEKASNPIALRYWNQCMTAAAGNSTDVSPNRSSDASPNPDGNEFKIEDLPWVSKTPEPEPSPKIVQPKQKISVPDIRRKMTTPEPIRSQDFKAPKNEQFAFNFTGVNDSEYQSFYNDKEKPPPLHSKTLNNRGQPSQFKTIQSEASFHKTNQSEASYHKTNQSEASYHKTNQSKDIYHKTNQSEATYHKAVQSESSHHQSNQSTASRSTKHQTVIVEKVLSTAGQGILRENEKQEAKLNLNRFITIGMLKSNGDSKTNDNLSATRGASSNGATNTNTNGATATNTNKRDTEDATGENRYDSGISSFSSDDSDEDADNNREGTRSNSTVHNSTNSVIAKGEENVVLEAELPLQPDLVAKYLDCCAHKELNTSIIQKLTSQRKNSIGMLFYKEMTEELIKEILAQELMSRSMVNLNSIIPQRLKQEIVKSELTKLGTKSANMVLNELQLARSNSLETLIPQPDDQNKHSTNIPQIIISSQQDLSSNQAETHNGVLTNGHQTITNPEEEMGNGEGMGTMGSNGEGTNGDANLDIDDETYDKSAAESYVSACSDIDNDEKGDTSFTVNGRKTEPTNNNNNNTTDPDGWSELADGSEGDGEDDGDGVLLEDLEEWEEHEEELLVQTFDATFNIIL